MDISSLPTPAILVDRPRAVRNIHRVQAMASGAGLRLRPHSKTHKSPVIARWQLDAGAVGICCAKLGEAEIMAAAGIKDIRLPYPVNPSNAARVLALQERSRISIIVDHKGVAQGWSDAMTKAGRSLDVLVKVDVGFHRCGISPDDEEAAERFVQEIARLPGLNLRGLLSHAGQAYHATSESELASIAAHEADVLFSLKARLEANDVPIDEVSIGATPTFRYSVKQAGITEVRPGNYVYFDRTQVSLGAAGIDDCALTVLATVVSKPASDRIILDCGSKTLTNDGARGIVKAPGYGGVLTADGHAFDTSLVIERLSEEHATVRVEGTTKLEPGDRVRIVPNHSCVVSNMVDSVCLVDGHEVLHDLRVEARGRIW